VEAVSPFVEAIQQFYEQPFAVRRDVVQTLLERAEDDRSFSILGVIAVEQPDPDGNLRWAIADGLRRVRRREAAQLLEDMATTDPHELTRARAVASLAELARAAYSSQAGPSQVDPSGLVRTRGPVRTRGKSPLRTSSDAKDILDRLHRLYENERSDYVREKVDITLRRLGE
jgi:hypothetical protein